MRKTFLFVLSLLICAVLCTAAVFAAEQTVYVKDGGKGDGTSAASPLGTLNAAVSALGGKGGTVIACGDVTINAVTTIPEQSGDFTLTAADGGRLLQGNRLQLGKNTNDNTFTFDLPIVMTKTYPVFIFGGFNSVHFTDKCVVTNNGANGSLHFMGGVLAASGTANAALVTTLPYSITVDGGDFCMFSAGTYRSSVTAPVGSIAAPVTITINGGTFGKAGSYDLTTNNKNYWDVSIADGLILADDATLNITGGTFNAPIFAQGRLDNVPATASETSALTASDRKYYAADGDIRINITGGTFNGGLISAYYTQAGYTQMLRGSFDVTIGAGATFAAGTVIDATQVKAYSGESKKATLTFPASMNIVPKRFDAVNGRTQTYEEPLRIACIGDSITQGTGAGSGAWDFETKAYPARLLELIEKNGGEAILGNYGIGGATVMPTNNIWYNDMLNFRLTREECDADWFIIGLGTNDAYNTMVTDGQHARFEEMYTAFVKGYGDLATTKKVFTTSALYRSIKKGSQRQSVLGAVDVRAMQRRVTGTLAQQSDKYVFVDLYALTFAAAAQVDIKGAAGALLSGDMLHPHAAGYQNVYAPAIYNAIFNGVTEVEGFSTLDTVYVSNTGRIDGAGTADDPISYIEAAIARLCPGADAEVRVIGMQTVSTWLTAPDDLKSIRFVGVGSDATLALDTYGKMIRFRTDAAIDNLKLNYTGSGALFVTCNYHNVEITDSVTIPRGGVLIAGHAVYGGSEVYKVTTNEDTRYFDSVAAGSSNADAAITVSGGTWNWIIGGNWRWKAYSPICTYGGNLVMRIGGKAKVTVSSDGQSGVCGANYLTGTSTLVTDIKFAGTLRDHAAIRLEDGAAFDATKNTGSVAVQTTDGGSVSRILTGDFDGDGNLNVRDALTAIGKLLNDGFTAADGAHYFGTGKISLRDVVWLLGRIA